jgi:hypothetical protein
MIGERRLIERVVRVEHHDVNPVVATVDTLGRRGRERVIVRLREAVRDRVVSAKREDHVAE